MLTPEELQSLRSTLDRQLALLRQQIGDEVAEQANDRYRDLAGEVTDLQDEAVGAEIAGTANALIGHETGEVRQIEEALARMAAGRYGTCIDCGDGIDFERLLAYPACTRCEACQEIHERTYAGGRHVSL